MKIENKMYLETQSYNTLVVSYWVNIFDRELIILFNDRNLLHDYDKNLIEETLDNAYIEWNSSEDPVVYNQCCEEFMINSLDTYYRNSIVAVLYGDDEEEE